VPHPLYLALGSTTRERLAAYRELFSTPAAPAEVEAIRFAGNSCLPLGCDVFVRAIGRQLDRRVAFRKNGRPSKKTEDRPRFPPDGN